MDVNYVSVVVRPSKRLDNNTILIREINEFDTLLTVKNDSATKRTLISLGWACLTCSGAVLGYIAITAEGVLIPFTGSLSATLIPLSAVGTIATSASCGVYTGKFINEVTGNGDSNDYLDHSNDLSAEAFRGIMTALDLIALSDIPSSFESFSRLLQQLTNKKLTKQSLLQRLKKMPRSDRKRLLKEIIKLDRKYINNKQLKAIIKAMNTPKVISQTQIRKAMIGELSGAISSTFGFIGSYADGALKEVRQRDCSPVNKFAIALITDSPKDL